MAGFVTRSQRMEPKKRDGNWVTTRRYTPEFRFGLFWSKIDHSAGWNGCWLWTGSCDKNGYGRMAGGLPKSAPILVHRYAYEMFIEPIPEGLVIDHLCNNPPCVNPAHLEPVTQAVNIQRAFGGI